MLRVSKLTKRNERAKCQHGSCLERASRRVHSLRKAGGGKKIGFIPLKGPSDALAVKSAGLMEKEANVKQLLHEITAAGSCHSRAYPQNP